MAVLRRVGPLGVPVIVWAFFAIDVALGTIYVVDHLLGTPFAPVTRMFDLDGESNVPTWYSSIQWFVVFAVLFGVAERRVSLADRRSWFLCLLPLVFLAMSADEVVQLHERIGAASDGLLFGGTRAGTALPETGIWFIVVGVPFVVAIIALFATIRPYLRRPSGALARIVVGLALLVSGATGGDFVANFLDPGSPAAILEILVEEMLEMVGATVILWGGVELLLGPDDPRVEP